MSYMFYNAQAFDVDLSLWDVNSVTSMPGMFDFTGLSDCNKRNIHNVWSSFPVF